jgi:hypothetical protein
VADAVLVTSGWFEGIRPATRGVLVCGLAGIACSVELYVVTRRSWWSAGGAGRFTAMTGGVLVAAVHLAGGASQDRSRLLTILLPVLAASSRSESSSRSSDCLVEDASAPEPVICRDRCRCATS